MTILVVALGAAVGAPARYLTDRAVSNRWRTVLPYGTLAVNVVGSLILGVLFGGAARHGIPAQIVAFAGTGFCGALTTYSTFGYETIRLMHDRLYRHAAINTCLSLVLGCLAAWLGIGVANLIWG